MVGRSVHTIHIGVEIDPPGFRRSMARFVRGTMQTSCWPSHPCSAYAKQSRICWLRIAGDTKKIEIKSPRCLWPNIKPKQKRREYKTKSATRYFDPSTENLRNNSYTFRRSRDGHAAIARLGHETVRHAPPTTVLQKHHQTKNPPPPR